MRIALTPNFMLESLGWRRFSPMLRLSWPSARSHGEPSPQTCCIHATCQDGNAWQHNDRHVAILRKRRYANNLSQDSHQTFHLKQTRNHHRLFSFRYWSCHWHYTLRIRISLHSISTIRHMHESSARATHAPAPLLHYTHCQSFEWILGKRLL